MKVISHVLEVKPYFIWINKHQILCIKKLTSLFNAHIFLTAATAQRNQKWFHSFATDCTFKCEKKLEACGYANKNTFPSPFSIA